LPPLTQLCRDGTRIGVVDYVLAVFVIHVNDAGALAGEVGVDITQLIKYQRSESKYQHSSVPDCQKGDPVISDVIADGASTDLEWGGWATC
jgi:DNA-directed RNA polymerase subunit beta